MADEDFEAAPQSTSISLSPSWQNVIFGTPTSSAVTFSADIVTQAGTGVTVKNRTDKGVAPQLIFKLVKSRLERLEKEKLQKKLVVLKKMIEDAQKLGQTALFDNLTTVAAIAARELEVHACGYDKIVPLRIVEKFQKVRKENGGSIVYFDPWEKFPRKVPPEVAYQIKRVQDLKLFDELWVLYLDYSKQRLETNKDKEARARDPILFGKFSYAPTRLYFIVDWIDEHCDLTLSKLVESVTKEVYGDKTDHPNVVFDEKIDAGWFEAVKANAAEAERKVRSAGRIFREEDVKARKLSFWERVKALFLGFEVKSLR